MNSLRRVVGILLAMTFVAFALPSYGGATDKLYSIDVDPTGTGNPIYGTQLRATVSNASPLQGNSQFSFVNLSVNLGWTLNPAGPVVITESGNPSPGGQSDFSVPGHLIISNLYPVKPQQSLTVTFYVNSSACGEGIWSVVATTGSNGGGDIFTVADESANDRSTLIPCGQLTCNTALTVQYGAGVTVTRGPNWDGTTACAATDVFMTDTLTTNQKAYGDWKVSDAPSGAFRYGFTGSLTNPKVAWFDTNGDPFIAGGNPNIPAFVYVNANPALICNPPNSQGDFFGRMYGKTVAFVSPTTTKFQIDPTGGVQKPPTLPVYAMLNGEVVQVTKWVTATNTVTVVRARAGTAADPPGGAPAGTPLMYTPFGVTTVASTNLPVNIQVKMCVTPDSPHGVSGFGGSGDWTYHDVGDGYFGGD